MSIGSGDGKDIGTCIGALAVALVLIAHDGKKQNQADPVIAGEMLLSGHIGDVIKADQAAAAFCQSKIILFKLEHGQDDSSDKPAGTPPTDIIAIHDPVVLNADPGDACGRQIRKIFFSTQVQTTSGMEPDYGVKYYVDTNTAAELQGYSQVVVEVTYNGAAQLGEIPAGLKIPALAETPPRSRNLHRSAFAIGSSS